MNTPTPNEKRYVLENVIEVLLGIYGRPDPIIDMIIDSGNNDWSVRLAWYCRERLTPEMRERLAANVIRSSSLSASLAFLLGVKGLSVDTRKRLLDNISPDLKNNERGLQLLSEPSTWGYVAG